MALCHQEILGAGTEPLTVEILASPGTWGTLCPHPLLHYLGPESHDAGQKAEEDVGVHAALVGLVHNQHPVLLQQEVLGEQGRTGHTTATAHGASDTQH
jgi:hypothetical protein